MAIPIAGNVKNGRAIFAYDSARYLIARAEKYAVRAAWRLAEMEIYFAMIAWGSLRTTTWKVDEYLSNWLGRNGGIDRWTMGEWNG
jgi:hypothetical protein